MKIQHKNTRVAEIQSDFFQKKRLQLRRMDKKETSSVIQLKLDF